jgi:hypothetical protein
VRNISAPAARRGRHLAPVVSRSHSSVPPLAARYYYASVLGLQPAWYLRLNEKFGAGGIAMDGSSTQLNATVNGTVTKIQPGPLVGDPTDLGYLFDGVTGFLEAGIPTTPLLSVFQNHDFTIEAWVKPTAAANFILSCGLFNSGTPGDQFLHFGFNSGVLKLGFFGDDLVGVLPVTTGVYHHIVGSWSAATRQQALYLDGMLDSVRTSSNPLAVPNNADLQVARVAFATGNGPFWYTGVISELAVYPIAFTQQQAMNHFLLGINAVPGVTPPRLPLEA